MTLRLSESELAEIQQRHAGFRRRPVSEQNLIPGGHTSKAIKAKPKGMNKWEEAFSRTLEYQRSIGEIAWWAFEPFRIRLADGCWYRPDFVSVDMAGKTSIWEVKGFMREAARIRLRVASEKLPYDFYLVRKHKGELRATAL